MHAARSWALQSIYTVLLIYEFSWTSPGLGVQAWLFSPFMYVVHSPLKWREAGDVLPLWSVCSLHGRRAQYLPGCNLALDPAATPYGSACSDHFLTSPLWWALLQEELWISLVPCTGTSPTLSVLNFHFHEWAWASGLPSILLLNMHRLSQSHTWRCMAKHSLLLFANDLLGDIKDILKVLKCLEAMSINQSEYVPDICFLRNR